MKAYFSARMSSAEFLRRMRDRIRAANIQLEVK